MKAPRQGHAAASYAVTDRAGWPADVRAFWESDEAERFALSGTGGDHLDFMRRGAEACERLSPQTSAASACRRCRTDVRRSRQLVASLEARDLRRGFTLTLLLLVAAVWLVSLVPLLFLAHRVSQPIRQLTAGLTGFAAGDWDRAAGAWPRRRGGARGRPRSTTWPTSCAAGASAWST